MKISASGITMTFEELIALDATIEFTLQEAIAEAIEEAYNLGVVDGINLGVEQALMEEEPIFEDIDNLLKSLLGL